jgi:hypothetical protein
VEFVKIFIRIFIKEIMRSIVWIFYNDEIPSHLEERAKESAADCAVASIIIKQ